MENMLRIAKKSIFSRTVLDADGKEFGFLQKGHIYEYLENTKSKGETCFYLRKKEKDAPSKAQYYICFMDEDIPYAYIDRLGNIYSLAENKYCGSVECSRLLIAILIVLLAVFIATAFTSALSGGLIANDTDSEETVQKCFLKIHDGETEWKDNCIINVFGNKEEEISPGKKLIYPGKKGSYKFKIENLNSISVLYKITFSEKNGGGIPLRFKLRQNGEYMSATDSEWVKLEDFNYIDRQLNANSTDTYVLEWLWIENNDVKDTKLGSDAVDEYKLKIRIDYGPMN